MENNDQAKWINIILDQLSKIENAQTKKAVENCGRECLKSNDNFKKIMALRNSIADKNNKDLLFKKYKEEIYNNSPNLYQQGNDIYLEYLECGCHMVTDGGINHPFICNCTVGYTQQTFETLFGEPVKVILLKSILNGDHICKQKISVLHSQK